MKATLHLHDDEIPIELVTITNRVGWVNQYHIYIDTPLVLTNRDRIVIKSNLGTIAGEVLEHDIADDDNHGSILLDLASIYFSLDDVEWNPNGRVK